MSSAMEGTSMQENNERLLQAIRAGNIGIFEHNHETDTIYWSPELRRMYGWTLEEVADLPKIISHVHPSDVERVVIAVRSAHDPNGDGSFDIEHRIIDRMGSTRWVLTRSTTYFEGSAGSRRPVRTVGAVQDVTALRAAEERLRVLDTVLTSSVQAVAIADPTGRITFVNAAACALWGYPDLDSLLGRSIFDLWTTLDEPAIALERIKEERIQTVETPATRLDGSPFHLAMTAEAVLDRSGTLTQILVTFADVTDRKRLEAQLAHAQKLESIGRLAGGIAHDFNNILTVISGNLQLGLAALPPEDRTQNFIRDAAEAARSAENLTRQLLAFSRKDAIAPRPVDMKTVIPPTERMIARLLGDKIRLETVCGDGLPPVCVDPGQLQQILMNLAANARDAMPNGGRLKIEASKVNIDKEEAARHVDARPGRYVLLTVSDNGVGMTEEVRAHLFEPFFTSKEPGKGTGLGLAMVYGAVRQNGGFIHFETALNRGTTFSIYLPVVSSGRRVSPSPPARL
jgi:two-component system, cell cycle sensor histidine kinase and response regulator CckA